MALIFTWMRIELRRRWRSLVVLALLVAISSGTVFTALAGARRAASAIDRLQAQTLPADAIVTPFEPHFDWDIVRALPQVEALATYSNTPNLVEGIADEDVTAFTPADTAALDTIERPVVLAGRLADPARADEVVVTPKFVESFGRGIGDTATVRLNSPETYDAISRAQRAAPAEPDGPTVVTRIVGVIRTPGLPDELSGHGRFVPSAGLFAQYRGSFLGASGAGFVDAAVRLRNGDADLPAFQAELARATGRPDIGVQAISERTNHLRDVLGFETAGLLAFGLVALIAALFLIGQSAARYTAAAVADTKMLGAVGMTPRQAVVAASAGPFLAALVGTSIGVGAAIVASRWLPFGAGALVEPNPGIDADWLVLGLGWLLVPALALAGSATAATVLRVASLSRASARRSAIALTATRAGLPVPVVVGARFALEAGRGPSAVPVRPALLGAVTGVLGVVAALVLSAGVTDAAEHPERFGFTAQIEAFLGYVGGEDAGPVQPVLDAMAADPDVSGVLDLRAGTAKVGDTTVTVGSYATVGEPVPVVIVAGGMPANDGETLLGTATAQRLGVGVGDSLTFTGDAGTQALRVSGIGFAPVGAAYEEGALVLAGGYDRLFNGFDSHGAVLALRPGADAAAVIARLQAATAAVQGGQAVPLYPLTLPPQFTEIQAVRALPLLLGVFLAVLAVGAVGHALATAVRRRRHDLVVLRALGMTRGQGRGVVITQASLLAGFGLLFGVPLGIALGRVIWRLIADNTPLAYVAPGTALAVLLVVPAALLLANLLAALPGQRAARLPVHRILRAE